jgi:hypothetical protein
MKFFALVTLRWPSPRGAPGPPTPFCSTAIVTADEDGSVHQALALPDGRIVALGKSAAISACRQANARGRCCGAR